MAIPHAKRRLMLVEDDATMRSILSARLEQEGFQVEATADGREALQKARERPPELILTDYEMPEVDGAALCRALKEDHELRSIPVLMLTSLGEVENRVSGLDAGADDYIQEPKTPDEFKELYARIRAHLRTADLQRELSHRNRQPEAANSKIKFELELARRIQRGLRGGGEAL